MATWKRKEREWTTGQDGKNGRKKKENGEEEGQVVSAEKGCKFGKVVDLGNGLGLAEVVS